MGTDSGPAHSFRDYRMYGISLRSEIPLGFPEQPAGPGGNVADVTFHVAPPHWFAEVTAGLPRHGSTDGWYERLRSADGSEFLRWPDLFEFMVSHDGRSVACGFLQQATIESFRTYLLGHVLSFALIKQGYEPLHATTVVVHGKALALLGESGYGKSTLAAAFLHAGHQILTDDLLLIGDVGGALCGFPGPPRVKLFPQVAQRFLPRQAPGAPMHPETEKLIIALEHHQVHEGPAPLHGFFILGDPDQLGDADQRVPAVSLASLSRTHSLLGLVRSTFNTRVATQDRLRRQFLAVQEWAERIPVRRLTYPRTLAMLDDVRRALVSDVGSSATASS